MSVPYPFARRASLPTGVAAKRGVKALRPPHDAAFSVLNGSASGGGEDGDRVTRDLPIARNEGQALDLRLSHEHTVEGVAVVQGERAGQRRVPEPDRELGEAGVATPLGYVPLAGKLSQVALELDLPHRHRAD